MDLFKPHNLSKPIFLFAIFTLFFTSSFSQQSFTTEQINRIADAGKVYGYIKYFHPYLQYKDINWDSAFVSNVQSIIDAKNKQKYAAIMQQMLSVLHDSSTCVVQRPKESSAYQLQETAYTIKDSILYINLNDVNDYSYDKIQEAYQKISHVKGIVFDMRKPVNSQFIYSQTSGTILDWAIMFSDNPLLFKGELLVPSLRRLQYRGSYEKSFKQVSVFKFTGTAEKNKPIVFIVSNENDVPLTAIALQQKGLAAIVQQEGKTLTIGKSTSFYIQDSVVIKMRVAEAVNADGSLCVIHPNATYSGSENPDSAVLLAKDLIVKGFKQASVAAVAAPQAINQVNIPRKEDNYPSVNYRMLAAATIFAEMDNFFPGKELMDRNWQEAYKAAVPKFIAARDSLEYVRAVAGLYSNIQDSHGFVTYGTFSLKLNPIIQGRGDFIPPVITSVIENKVVVTGIYNDSVCTKTGIKKGDVILSIDGKDPLMQIEEARKYQSASTKASQTFFISKFLLFGKEGQIRKLKVQGRDEKIRMVDLPTLTKYDGNWYSDDYTLKIYSQHLEPTFKLLTKDIGYADITSLLSSKDVDSMFKVFKNTKAIIFDDRGYPHCYIDFSKFAINKNAALHRATTPVAIAPNIDEIGMQQNSFKETYSVNQSDYKDWNTNNSVDARIYKGKIVVLINEAPQSAGEDVAIILKTSANATLIGTPTSGTDGGMTSFVVPGNITLWYTEEIVSFPDGKRTQRIGVQPDIYVQPTIKGIQSGKDEVLERAVKYLRTGK
ncbi:MAG: hypothetical protein JWR61_4701 [Ferruginibacter sp.]|uniref:S41 family peptidase n=1 Tax=Ferruginibacter sp. TaxID=1940288 RepID=UPI0026598090|nr:S41 family peptidase [Ferruginibacter sp.]MDB5279746.1 hypothetical protein [Ferruginibacter sp.]